MNEETPLTPDETASFVEKARSLKLNAGPAQPIQCLVEEFPYLLKMKECVEQMKNKYGVKCLRKIRGDGNCYYRAVYYGYFELVISSGKEALRALIEIFHKEHIVYFHVSRKDPSVTPCLLRHFIEIYKVLAKHGKNAALALFYKKVVLDTEFDLNCVKFLRLAASIFIDINTNFLFNGFPIASIAIEDSISTLKEYNTKVVERMDESARSLVLSVIPLLLRCSIEIFFLDTEVDKGQVFSKNYNAITTGFDFSDHGPLDFHDKNVKVLLKPGHYDFLSSYDTDYDAEFSKLYLAKVGNIRKESNRIEENKKAINSVYTPCCKSPVEKLTLLQIIKDAKEVLIEEAGKFYLTCPVCNDKRLLEEYKTIFTADEYDKIIEIHRNKVKEKNMLKLPCCKKVVSIPEFIKKAKGSPIISSTAKCPFCQDRIETKILGPKVVERLLDSIPYAMEKCLVCSNRIVNDKNIVQCPDCYREFHTSCLTSKVDPSTTQKCRCGMPIAKLKAELKIGLLKPQSCTACKEIKVLYQTFPCGEGFCVDCFDKYLKGTGMLKGDYNVFRCSSCNESQELSTIKMSCCNREVSVKVLKEEIQKRIIYKIYNCDAIEVVGPTCQNCGHMISEKEVALVFGKDEVLRAYKEAQEMVAYKNSTPYYPEKWSYYSKHTKPSI